MRRLIPVLLLALGLAVVAILLRPKDTEDHAPQPGDRDPSAQTPSEPLRAGSATQPAGAHAGAASRTAVAGPAEPGAAATPVRFRVVDADTRLPLAGATVRGLDARILATTAGDGRAELSGKDLSELVFVASGYLLNVYAVGEAATAAVRARAKDTGVFEVELIRDQFSLPCTLRFRTEPARTVERVRFTLTCLAEPTPLGGSLPRARIGANTPVAPALLAAWQRHALLAQLPRQADVLCHLGAQSHGHEYASGAVAEMRLVAEGRYLVEAVTASGEAARSEIVVAATQDASFDITLHPGHALAGIVVGAAGKPVAGAHVLPQGVPPWIGAVQTDVAGRFRLAPLAAAELGLEIRHAEHEPLLVAAVRPGTPDLRLTLTPLARRVVQGTVRLRPRSTPVVGARVTVQAAGQTLGEAITDASGRFALQTSAEDCELAIEAAGCLRYVEGLDPSSRVESFDLVPATLEARVRAGLSTQLMGRVLGPDGSARPRLPVQVVAENSEVPLVGRRIFAGGLPAAPNLVTTDADGTFQVECTQAGRVRVVPVDGVSGADDGILVTVALGVRMEPVIIRTRK